jgi:pyruvate,water dikinase
VARELGISCVVGTGNGTKVLRTGDVHVDGSTGEVAVLARSTG